MSVPLDIDARGLAKRFGRTAALRGVSFSLQPGERLALFGPNGSGKTTLLKLLAGLMRPTRGELRVQGTDYKRGANAIRRRIGVVSHHTYLYDDLTAEENLLFYGRMYGIEELTRTVDRALRKVGIEGRRRDKVHTYSRGMQQRLSLARATLHDPEILLLDEPDTGLDQEASRQLSALLERESGRRRSVVMATHDLRLGAENCDRFLILAGGRVAYEGERGGRSQAELEELYQSHASAS